ncbi:hypothetical protein LAZ67_2006685 [Cordylochernes scorpioides]|uniref:Uncharacterized protein n=1 Tax=Cordylochernes scorpioides TaxID=51811 RepID=A0ABY6K8G0_9ARAC|nr:hypothetical protein LAZ67_2006685 [Cordylochernes scorpioides]
MYSVGRRTKRWPLCLFFNFLDVVAINSAVIYKAVKQDGGMARKDFIKQLALQLMRDALNMRNQAKYLSRDLQVLIQKHAGTSSLEEQLHSMPGDQKKQSHTEWYFQVFRQAQPLFLLHDVYLLNCIKSSKKDLWENPRTIIEKLRQWNLMEMV